MLNFNENIHSQIWTIVTTILRAKTTQNVSRMRRIISRANANRDFPVETAKFVSFLWLLCLQWVELKILYLLQNWILVWTIHVPIWALVFSCHQPPSNVSVTNSILVQNANLVNIFDVKCWKKLLLKYFSLKFQPETATLIRAISMERSSITEVHGRRIIVGNVRVKMGHTIVPRYLFIIFIWKN